MPLTPEELELLQGMCNCYSACGANFEGTVKMVGGARGLTPIEVKQILARVKEEHCRDKDYRALRERLPSDFPL